METDTSSARLAPSSPLYGRRGTDIAVQIAMADFDTIVKHLIQTYPADFARFALQRDDIQEVEVLESEQPSTRRPDSLLRVELADRKVLVHHEFQTTDDSAMPRRMAEYIGRFIGKHGLPVHSHVLYLRPNAGRRDPGYYLQEHPDYSILIRYKVIRLSQSCPVKPCSKVGGWACCRLRR